MTGIDRLWSLELVWLTGKKRLIPATRFSLQPIYINRLHIHLRTYNTFLWIIYSKTKQKEHWYIYHGNFSVLFSRHRAFLSAVGRRQAINVGCCYCGQTIRAPSATRMTGEYFHLALLVYDRFISNTDQWHPMTLHSPVLTRLFPFH